MEIIYYSILSHCLFGSVLLSYRKGKLALVTGRIFSQIIDHEWSCFRMEFIGNSTLSGR